MFSLYDLDWDEGVTFSIYFNPFQAIAHWNVTMCLKIVVFFRWGLFECVQTEAIVSNYHIKICSKNNQQEDWKS